MVGVSTQSPYFCPLSCVFQDECEPLSKASLLPSKSLSPLGSACSPRFRRRDSGCCSLIDVITQKLQRWAFVKIASFSYLWCCSHHCISQAAFISRVSLSQRLVAVWVSCPCLLTFWFWLFLLREETASLVPLLHFSTLPPWLISMVQAQWGSCRVPRARGSPSLPSFCDSSCS